MSTTGNNLPVFKAPEPPPIILYRETVINLIKKGKFPSVEGMHFSDTELEEMQVALKIRGDAIARYFDYVKSQSAINV